MPRPGTDINIIDGSPPGAAALDTGTAFFFGVAERGPVNAAVRVASLTEYQATFGARAGGSLLYDAVRAYFSEGGGGLYVSRVLGSGATVSTIAFGSATVKSVTPGTWGNAIKVNAVAPIALAELMEAQRLEGVDPQVAGDPIAVTVEYPVGTVVERSPTVASVDALVAWALEFSDYVRFTKGADNIVPAAGVTATLAGGTAGAAPTQVEIDAAIARFEYGFGPGQVCGPGYTTSVVHKSVLAHCDATHRCALLDLPDSPDPLVLSAAVNALASTPGVRFASAWGPWAVYPAETAPATITIPYSAIEAGIISRVDRGGNPNAPAAGADGISRLAVGLSQTFTDAQREALNAGGVDLAKLVYGEVRSYGYRTAAGALDRNWLWYGNSRTLMAIAFECDSVAESYVLKQIDGRGQIFSRLNKDLAGVCSKYYDMNALYGETPEEAFLIDTGPGVNTDATIANGEMHAVVKVKVSPAAEWVVIDIVKVPVERPIAA